MKTICATLAGLLIVSSIASAQFMTSPTSKGALPTSVSVVGGVVLDLVGTNNNRIVSQLSASSLFVGFANTGTPVSFQGNPLTIGVQSGFTPALVAALGGGIAEAAVRFTLYDGDTALNNFDWFDNDLLLNGINIADWSTVTTYTHNSVGGGVGSPRSGFDNNALNTGFFHVTNSTVLASFYNSIVSSGSVAYGLLDEDPFDNFFDFTQGIDSSLIDVSTPPVVNPVIPEPSTVGAFAVLGLLGLVYTRKRMRA